ncbi:MAG: hypothetical protein VYD19_08855 [Myxococcota bacterium]|nr:hypothetical protein [Myxococcota bacterium]
MPKQDSLQWLRVPAGWRHHESASGHCARCRVNHRLPAGAAVTAADQLLGSMLRAGRVDFQRALRDADPSLTLERLFPGDRAHTFGVLEAVNTGGEVCLLYAYSSLPGGIREIEGWVPPTLGAGEFDRWVKPRELEIKAMSEALAALPSGTPEWCALRAARRETSRRLWRDLLDRYRLPSIGGLWRPMVEVSLNGDQLPSGTGECCAPKLLTEAARRGLRPRSIAEFSWGLRETSSSSWSRGILTSSCNARCGLILGFMLCPESEPSMLSPHPIH